MISKAALTGALLSVELTASFVLSGCQSLNAHPSARLDLSDPSTRTLLSAALAQAMGRAHVDLGPDAQGQTSVVTVLPPPPGPFETHSLAMPVAFDIRRQGDECIVVRRDTDQAYPVAGVTCSR